MTALNAIRNYKNSIAAIFAASILAITACDVLCSTDRSGSMQMKHPLTASSENAGSNKHHHNNNEYQKHHASVTDITTQTLSQSSTSQGDDDCCKDITNQFYKSLFNGDDLSIAKASVQNYVPLILVDNYHLLTSVHYQNPFRVELKKPPNSAGHSLRILFSSFLI